MSLKALLEAQKILLESKKEVENLKKLRDASAKSVAEAKGEVDHFYKNEKKKEETDSKDTYGDLNYWHNRFKTEDAFEWYLSFEEWKPYLFKDIKKSNNRKNNKNKSIMVSGCGNSSDEFHLWKLGCQPITAADFDSNVIEKMKKKYSKHKDKIHGLDYKTVDVRNMIDFTTSQFNIVVDKGTLDAIFSADDGQDAANKYMNELHRVIQDNGSFLLLTNMPPHLVNEFMTEANHIQMWSSAFDSATTIKTKEGGEVFYYNLQRKKENKSSNENNDTTTTFTTTNYNNNNDTPSLSLEEMVKNALKEVENARSDLTKAAKNLDENQSLYKSVAEDFKETNRKKEEMMEKLETSINTFTSQVKENPNALDESGSLPPPASSLIDTTDAQEDKDSDRDAIIAPSAHPVPPVPPIKAYDESILPTVQIEIDYEDSNVVAGGHVTLWYKILQGQWDEDDSIHLYLSSNDHDNITTTSNKEPLFDSDELFEYTSRPEIQSFPVDEDDEDDIDNTMLIGSIKVPLPNYGGIFYLKYLRTFSQVVTLDKEKHKYAVERSDMEVVRSECLNVPCTLIQQSSHRGRVKRRGVLKKGYIEDNSIFEVISENSLSRSSFNMTILPNLELCHKKYCNILVDNESEDDKGRLALTKVMGWLEKNDNNNESSDENSTYVLVEADICLNNSHSNCKDDANNHQAIVYAKIKIPSGFDFDFNKTLIQVVGDDALSQGGQKLACRLPYVSKDTMYTSNIDNMNSYNIVRRLLSNGSVSKRGFELNCSFCDLAVSTCNSTDAAEIQVKQRSSGVFDHMMHEMVCCECPNAAIMSTQLTPADNNEILVDNGCISLNARLFNSKSQSSLSFYCDRKDHTTLIDAHCNLEYCYNNPNSDCGICFSPISSIASEEVQRTCIVRCQRCGQYIGDGIMAHHNNPATATDTINGKIDVADVEIINFALFKVKINGNIVSSTKIGMIPDINTFWRVISETNASSAPFMLCMEHMISNILYKLKSQITMSAVLMLQMEGDSNNIIGLRYMADNIQIDGLGAVVKVLFKCFNQELDAADVTDFGVPMQPINLDYDDWCYLYNVLSSRSTWFQYDQSPFSSAITALCTSTH